MKKILNIISYVMTICLFCVLYIFLFDLVCIGKISKFNHIWQDICALDIDDSHLTCMVHYDIAFIIITLLMLCCILFFLKKKRLTDLLSIPLVGLLLFVLSVITFWGLV